MKAAIQGIPQNLVMLVAVTFSVMYFVTALPRLFYPYDLDFLEDSVLMESLRVANQQSVYSAPNADFNPHVYMPLFFLLGGILFKLGGPSLSLLRSISFGSTIGTTFIIYKIAKHESGLAWVAIACAGLFLGGYRISGYWYELARVDSLFVALTLMGMTLAIYAGDSNRQLVLSSIWLALSALTKQTGFVVGIGIALYLFLTIGWRAVWFAVTFAGLTAIPLLMLNLFTNGWFFYHIIRIGSADPIQFSRLVAYFTDKIFGVMLGLSLMVILILLLGLKRSRLGIICAQPWLVAIGIAILISAMGRIRVGGNLNNLMPGYALLCLAPALLIRESTDHIFFWDRSSKGILMYPRYGLLATLILVQFILGAYSPARYIPTFGMRQSADRFIQQIASVKGPVLVMMHPYYALLAGKVPSTQIATLWYVRDRGALPLPDDFINKIKSQFYSEIISDESFFETQPDLQTLLNKYYFPAETLAPSQAAATNTGVVVRPKMIYLPYQHQDVQPPGPNTKIGLQYLHISYSCCSMPFQGGTH